MGGGVTFVFFATAGTRLPAFPREFEMDAGEVILRREDDHLVIEPVKRLGLLATLARLAPLEEEYPDIESGLSPLDDVTL